jgi:hypothetical protein
LNENNVEQPEKFVKRINEEICNFCHSLLPFGE